MTDEEFEEPSQDELQPDDGFSSPLSTPEQSEPISAPVKSEPIKERPPVKRLDKEDIAVLISETRPAGIMDEDVMDLVENASRSPYSQLRIEAALTYMTDPDKCSIRRLHNDERFSKLGESTLMLWCRQDGWVEKRKHFLSFWAANAYKKIGSKLSQERSRDLDILLKARDMAMEKLEDPETKPRSFEGVLTAIVKASERIQTIQESIIEDIMPPDQESDSPLLGGGHTQISDGSMDSMVGELLKREREAMRVEEKIDVTESDAEAIAEQKEVADRSITAFPEAEVVEVHLDVSDLTGAADIKSLLPNLPKVPVPTAEVKELGKPSDEDEGVLSPTIVRRD